MAEKTKYMQIADEIRNQILSGTLEPNHPLPTEKKLCDAYRTSKMTVKKALDTLVAEGLIIKRRGYGTVVKDVDMDQMQHDLLASQFRGLTASNPEGAVTSKVLGFEVVHPNGVVAQKLNLSEDGFVYDILRVRYIHGKPGVLEHTYMPINLITGIRREHLEGSLYRYIEEDIGLKIQSAHRMIHVRKCTESEANALEVMPGDPVAVSQQIAFLENGNTFEYSVSVTRADYFEFKTVILR